MPHGKNKPTPANGWSQFIDASMNNLDINTIWFEERSERLALCTQAYLLKAN